MIECYTAGELIPLRWKRFREFEINGMYFSFDENGCITLRGKFFMYFLLPNNLILEVELRIQTSYYNMDLGDKKVLDIGVVDIEYGDRSAQEMVKQYLLDSNKSEELLTEQFKILMNNVDIEVFYDFDDLKAFLKEKEDCDRLK